MLMNSAQRAGQDLHGRAIEVLVCHRGRAIYQLSSQRKLGPNSPYALLPRFVWPGEDPATQPGLRLCWVPGSSAGITVWRMWMLGSRLLLGRHS